MANQTTLVHVTHETIGKIGGIGAVLDGLFTSNSYLNAIGRSIIVGPLFSTDGDVQDRLGPDGEVLYSSVDGFANTGYFEAFHRIELLYNVGIVYGRRLFVDKQSGVHSSPEVVLIDINRMDKERVNEFKGLLFEHFGIQSNLYEHLWEYEQYVRLAPPAIAILKVIGAAGSATTIVSHEFMGMPTVLAGIINGYCDYKTAFYAHEVATMRRIIEKHPGHDTMFYNALEYGHDNGFYVDEIFGEQNFYFKHALVDASRNCTSICAVGDYVLKELQFMSPEFESANINIVYNGIPAYKIGIYEKIQAKAMLQLYCENLLDFRPDFIFTHVTRLVQSKGLWRDLKVLERIEKEFRTLDRTAVMFLLSTEVAQRRTEDIIHMESEYGWPVAHREGGADLSGGEARLYTQIQQFNAKSRNIKIIFINQFGFNPSACGTRMPIDMEFMDLRKGTDVEFGLSIYEPFGIAQLEPLTFGGICVFTNVCGCAGFVRDVSNGKEVKNIIIADYTDLSGTHQDTVIQNPIDIDGSIRDRVEHAVSDYVAAQICSRLSLEQADIEQMLNDGHELAKKMSWEVVVDKYLLNTLRKTGQNACV